MLGKVIEAMDAVEDVEKLTIQQNAYTLGADVMEGKVCRFSSDDIGCAIFIRLCRKSKGGQYEDKR
jgi:hypothetical protein